MRKIIDKNAEKKFSLGVTGDTGAALPQYFSLVDVSLSDPQGVGKNGQHIGTKIKLTSTTIKLDFVRAFAGNTMDQQVRVIFYHRKDSAAPSVVSYPDFFFGSPTLPTTDYQAFSAMNNFVNTDYIVVHRDMTFMLGGSTGDMKRSFKKTFRLPKLKGMCSFKNDSAGTVAEANKNLGVCVMFSTRPATESVPYDIKIFYRYTDI